MSKSKSEITWISLACIAVVIACLVHKVDVNCIQCHDPCYQESVMARIFTGFDDNAIHIYCVDAYCRENLPFSAKGVSVQIDLEDEKVGRD